MAFESKDGQGNSKFVETQAGDGSGGSPFLFSRHIKSIAEGASPDIGDKDDAAVVTDAVGSLSAKLRGLVKWAFERMPGSLGQKTMANSLPVVFASDQTGIPITAGNAAIGGVKHNGPYWTPSDTIVDSANQSGAAADLSPAPTAGQKIVIDHIFISVGAALTVTVKEETSGAVLYKLYMAANTHAYIGPFAHRKLAAADKKVQIQTSGAGNIFAACGSHSEA